LFLQALEQATFALPQALAAALVTCSVPLPRPLTHLAAVFDQYGLALAAALAQKPQATQAPHVFGQQILLESACKGLELREALPHFADSSNRCMLLCKQAVQKVIFQFGSVRVFAMQDVFPQVSMRITADSFAIDAINGCTCRCCSEV